MMRTLITTSLLTAMTLSGAAMAAPAVPLDAGSQDLAQHAVANPRFRLSAAQYKALQGDYAMSDGRTLNVSSEGRKLFAELAGHARTELIPTGSNTFSARGEDMIVTFDNQGLMTNDVTVTLPKE